MKTEDPSGQPDCELQAQESMLFASTAVANGSCIAVVTATGMRTEIGKIQEDITAAAGEDDDTPLKRKLNDFGDLLARV
jgi:P-type Ca2+ transporter type 2C